MKIINENSVLNQGKVKELVSKTKTIGEHTIAYDVINGSESPERTMIICHGAFATRHVGRVLAAKLADLRPDDRIILVDAPWHGDSTSTQSIDGADVNTYADVLGQWVTALRDDLTIEGTLSWFGWSMGGSIGLLMDLDGQVIDELILINSSPVWESLEMAVEAIPPLGMIETTRDVFKGAMLEDFKIGVSDEERDDIMGHYDVLISPPNIMVNDIEALSVENYDIRDELVNIAAKTMILGGRRDNLSSVPMLELMNERIPNSIMHIGPNTHSDLMTQDGAETIMSCFNEVFIENKPAE